MFPPLPSTSAAPPARPAWSPRPSRASPSRRPRPLLRFMPQTAAADVARVLKSATANAENNHNLSADELFVVDADRQRGSDHQALAAAGPGSGIPDPQAHDPHHHRRRGPGGLTWDTRSTRTASAWVSHAPGPRSGTRTRNTPPSSRRTSRSASCVERAARERERQRRRDRAWHQPRHGHHPHRQAGHRDRQGRRRTSRSCASRSAR